MAAVKIGVLGTAGIAEKNIAAMKQSRGVEIYAVASRSLERAQAYAEKNGANVTGRLLQLPLGVPQAYGSYDELLQDEQVTAVYIPLPTAARVEWVARAARAGKHILSEKPTARNLAELRETLAAVNECNVIWMDGVMFMHHKRLPQLLSTRSEIGQLLHIQSTFTFMGTDDFYRQDIRVNPETEPLGCLGDLGWYNIRFSLAMCDFELPQSAAARAFKNVDGTSLPLDMDVQLVWADGRRASFDCSFCRPLRQAATLTGNQGHIMVDDFVIAQTPTTKFVVSTKENFTGSLPALTADTREVVSEECTQEVEMWNTFGKMVLARTNGDEPAVSTQDPRSTAYWQMLSLRTQSVIDACMRSAYQANGAPVSVEEV